MRGVLRGALEFVSQVVAGLIVFGCMMAFWAFLALLVGCTPKQTLAPVTLPPVCSAPRELPSMPDLPAMLPNLPTASQDYAADLLANRIASQELYAACVSRYSSLRDWVTHGN